MGGVNAARAPDRVLKGWVPIIGAFSLWFAHFLLVYLPALIWPDQFIARLIAIIATAAARVGFWILFRRIRTASATSEQTGFARRFGFGALFISVAGIIFDALPALMS